MTTCNHCHLPISGNIEEDTAWEVKFTIFSNSQFRVEHYEFHNACFENGRIPILRRLSIGRWPMGAQVEWGQRQGGGRQIIDPGRASFLVMDANNKQLVKDFKSTIESIYKFILKLLPFVFIAALTYVIADQPLSTEIPSYIFVIALGLILYGADRLYRRFVKREHEKLNVKDKQKPRLKRGKDASNESVRSKKKKYDNGNDG